MINKFLFAGLTSRDRRAAEAEAGLPIEGNVYENAARQGGGDLPALSHGEIAV